jgi:NAD(P)-dependent dehydrogenase (short-subunit alcohol dehydrogenase family)
MLDQDEFKGKVTLITGIGHPFADAVARRFASLGAALVLVHDPGNAEAAARLEVPAETLRLECDAADAAAVKTLVRAVVAQLGRIDLLICGWFQGTQASLLEVTADEWKRSIDAQLSAALNFNREMIKPMMRTKSGRIINVLYGAGAASSVASRGVWAMTRSLSAEVAVHGIYVNCISVGELEEAGAVQEAASRSMLTRDASPLGRLGRAEEAAQAAVFLASDLGKVTNGQMLRAAGGLTYE